MSHSPQQQQPGGEALKEASELGYAEADPTLDVGGFDARSKLRILMKLAFGLDVSEDEIPCRGITEVTATDFEYAKLIGGTVKLLGVAKLDKPGGDRISAFVSPVFVPDSSTLSAISGRRRIALLGDMLELGSTEDDLHVQVLEHALTLGLDLIGTAGPRYARARQTLIDRGQATAEQVCSAADAPQLARRIDDQLVSGDLLLLKGSRGLLMETVLDHLSTGPASEA